MPRINWKNIDRQTFTAYYRRKGQAAAMAQFGIGKTTCQTMARLYNVKVDADVTKRLRSEGLKRKTTSTPEIDAILREKYLSVAVRPLAKLIGRSHAFVRIRLRQLGLIIPDELIAERKKMSQIKAGSISPNKGKRMNEYLSPEKIEKVRANMFKKGSSPHNTLHDNAITIRYDHKHRVGAAYKWIRLAQGKWEPLHRYLWQQVHGPIPKGYCIRFKDGNTLNCVLSNLEMISRGENGGRNSAGRTRQMKEQKPVAVKMPKPPKVKEQKPAKVKLPKPPKVKAPKRLTARQIEAAKKRAIKQAQRNERERKWAEGFLKQEKLAIPKQVATKPCRIDERTTIYIFDNQDPAEERRKYLERLAERAV